MSIAQVLWNTEMSVAQVLWNARVSVTQVLRERWNERCSSIVEY